MCAEKWLNIVEKLVVVGEKIFLSPSTIGGHMKKGIEPPQKNHLKLHLYIRFGHHGEEIGSSLMCT